MKFEISTELVIAKGADIAQGVSLFNHLVFSGQDHCCITCGGHYFEVVVYSDTQQQADEVCGLASHYLNGNWSIESKFYSDAKNPFWYTEFHLSLR